MKVALFLAACVVGVYCQRDAVTVDPGTGGSLTDLSGTNLSRKYCYFEGKTCDLPIVESNFCGTEFQCSVRCNQRRDCISFHYSATRVCRMYGNRCSPPTVAAAGKYFYRLKLEPKESCPAGSQPYVPPEDVYSTTFCMLWGARCKGQGYYQKPQSADTYEDCLRKCVKIKTCSMVNYDSVLKKCEPIISDPCPDPNLVEDKPCANFLRMPSADIECPDNRGKPAPEPPAPTPAIEPPEPEIEPEEPEPETTKPATADCGGKKYVEKVFSKGAKTVTASCGAGCTMSVCHCKPYSRCDGARFTADGKCRVDVLTGKNSKKGRKGKNIYAHIKCVPGSSIDTHYISTSTPGTRLQCGDGYRLGDCTWFAYRRDRFTKTWRGGNKKTGAACGVPTGKRGRGCFQTGRCISTGVCFKKK